ncbi:hypothetical protein HYU45_02275 [Candidatus Daviesbacteria bacterium]|nr:hypothetical protein [Candidatus Daviesbacteria bacterium]
MSEGSSTSEEVQITKPVISGESVRATPRSRISRFSQWLRNFGKGEKPPKNVQLESTETEQTKPASKEPAILPSRQEERKVVVKNIANILTDKLNKESNIVPLQVENMGVAAIGGTNETVSRGFFEAIRVKNPDGYLVGVGVGNVFTLLHCFPEGTLPKGIILADVDPAVIAIGKLMVKKLRESETFEEFDRQVHGLSEEEFIREIQEIVREEENSILTKRLDSLSREDWTKVWRYTAKNKDDASLYKYWNPEQYDGTPYQGAPINVIGAMKERFSVLKQLADSNNIALVYADFTNSSFIDAVRELPEFSNSTNIIYLSNIIDHITGRGYQFGNAKVMEVLKAYENSTKPPVFVDTLQSLNYFLRVRNALPVYTHEDLMMPLPKHGVKPDGLIFADTV